MDRVEVMAKPRVPASEKFCKDCGAWCGDMPRYAGLLCRKCYNIRKAKRGRDIRAGTYVPARVKETASEESKYEARLAIAAQLKRDTHGGNIPKNFMTRSPA